MLEPEKKAEVRDERDWRVDLASRKEFRQLPGRRPRREICEKMKIDTRVRKVYFVLRIECSIRDKVVYVDMETFKIAVLATTRPMAHGKSIRRQPSRILNEVDTP